MPLHHTTAVSCSSLPDRLVVVLAPRGTLRDEIAVELERGGIPALVADSRAAAQRLLRMFRCDAVVCVVGAPTDGLRSLPAAHPGPRYVAIDATGGASALEGFDAVVPIGAAGLAGAVRVALADLLAADAASGTRRLGSDR